MWIAVGILALAGCQRPVKPEVKLPGTAPFLRQAQTDSIAALVKRMSLDDKLRQLMVLSVDKELPAGEFGYGGLAWSGLSPEEWQHWREQQSEDQLFPPLYMVPSGQLPGSHLEGGPQLPAWSALRAIGEDSLRRRLERAHLEQGRALRLNVLALPQFGQNSLGLPLPTASWQRQGQYVNQLSGHHLLSVAAGFAARDLLQPDSSHLQQLGYLRSLIASGLGGIELSPALLGTEEDAARIARFFRQELSFGGLLFAPLSDRSQMDDWLRADADLFIVQEPGLKRMMDFLRAAYRRGQLREAALNDKVERILLARHWVAKSQASPSAPREFPALEAKLLSSQAEEEAARKLPLQLYLSARDWPFWRQKALESALVLAANPGDRIPMPNDTAALQVWHWPEAPFSSTLEEHLQRYRSTRQVTEEAGLRSNAPLVLVLHNETVDAAAGSYIRSLSEQYPLTLVNLGQPENLRQLDTSYVVLQAFDTSEASHSLAAQLLMGGIPAQGRLPEAYSPLFQAGQGCRTTVTRLGYGSPLERGLLPERLVGIDAIVQSAIDEQAFPGAQLLVAKEGEVIYRKAFGHHTYQAERRVKTTDLYDLASITKVAATTLVAMQQYDAGAFELNDRLRVHLELPRYSRLRNLKVERLLSHRTGIQPHLPVLPYLLERHPGNVDCSRYFCREASPSFTIAVADSFYFARKYYDQIWEDMHRLRTPYTRFRYSDVNFVLLQRLLETLGGKRLDSLAAEAFYQPLGLQHLQFLPGGRSDVVPTEYDQRWRHQQIHGHVHDESAALLGGVAGHAGLFGKADDLAVIFQMLLNEGAYGGQRFLEASTVRHFTAAKHGNHRGLGFDKPKKEEIGEEAFPDEASTEVFGHTGFTGTCVWADPEQELIYIFLSNRVYPDRSNRKLFQNRVRERIHALIYDALHTYEPHWPELAQPESLIE